MAGWRAKDYSWDLPQWTQRRSNAGFESSRSLWRMNYVSFIAELASVLSDCVHSELQTRSRIEIPVKVTLGAK
jgi:hypothetical protein